MEIIENMYYGFGRILLALSLADGKIDASEIAILEQRIAEVAIEKDIDLELILITFENWKKEDSFSVAEMMKGGLHDFHLGDFHLTSELAGIFRGIVEDIITAEIPVTESERKLADEFITYLAEREQNNL